VCGSDVLVPSERLEQHRTHCVRLRRRCERCGLAVDLGELEAHMQGEHTLDVCVCGASMERRALAAHVASECPLRAAECPYCHVISSADEVGPPCRRQRGRRLSCGRLQVDQHKGFCGNQSEVCSVPACGTRVLRKSAFRCAARSRLLTAVARAVQTWRSTCWTCIASRSSRNGAGIQSEPAAS
jgi:hypothetical protein